MENNDKLFIGIDFETANSHPLSACAVGLVVFKEGEVVFEYEALIKPPQRYREFKYFNTTIHKIVASDVKDALTWAEIYPLLSYYLENSLIVAHNAEFDIRVLRSLNKYYNLSLPPAQYFCSVDLSRMMLPYLVNHKLNTVSDFLKINLDHHDAKSDAMASAMIVYKFMIMTKTNNLFNLLESINMQTKSLNI